MNELKLLKKHKELELCLIAVRNEELDFLSDHPNCDFWDEEEHVNILDHIVKLESQLNEVNEILKKIS